MTGRRDLHGEEGASLLLAMGFVTFVAVFCVSILAFTGVGSTTTTIVRGRADQRWGAEAGIEYGIASLAANPTRCSLSGTSTYAWSAFTSNEHTTTSACTYLTGGSAQAGNAVLGSYGTVVSGSGGITVSPSAAANVTFDFDGSVHAVGPVTTQSTRKINIRGALTTAGACPSVTTVLATAGCTPSSGMPALPGAGTVLVPSVNALASKVSGTNANCTILYPGRYGAGFTALPAFVATRDYYLASGNYYFNSIPVTLQGLTIFGGAKAATETQQLTATPCATDAVARALQPTYPASGTGATFVLGGTATVVVKGASSKVELFARVPGGTEAKGIGVVAAPDTTSVTSGTYNRSTVVDPAFVFSVTDKSADLVMHGFAYLPSAGTSLSVVSNDDADGAPVFYGGIYVSRITITADSTAGARMYVAAATNPRVVSLLSTSAGLAGAASTTITATVRLGPIPDVSSWRVG